MKKQFIPILLLVLTINVFSQQTVPSPPLTKQDHYQKSKNQKTAAIALVTGGSVIMLIGIPSWTSGFSDGLDFFNPDPEAGTKEMKSANAFFIAGGVLILGSVPLFIASAKSKLRGVTLSFKKETATLVRNRSFVNSSVPSLTLKISL